ncbi:MAG TPA: discoidin domain-containing protein [Candidatus Acidoferrales bacterium]
MTTSRRRFLGATVGAAALSVVGPLADAVLADQGAPNPPSVPTGPTLLRVHAAASKVANSFDPDQALATSMDIQSREAINRIYTPETVKLCLSAGWGPISYRLHTPETVDYWHWNPNGRWTDEANKSGYFIGTSDLGEPIHDSFGYSLPHRGCTHNGGTNQGYSRLTDGDPKSFWKSNPYLTKPFTHDDDSLHPQWVLLDLDQYFDVNAIRIDWCEPSAREYEIQYWVGDDPMNWEEPAMGSDRRSEQFLPVADQALGNWVRFPNGLVRDGKGGSVTLKLSDKLISTRYVRVVMTQSNNQPGPHGNDDVRHRVGYAIYQVYVGKLEADGKFADFVRHSANRQQTATYCSSTDPWHSVENLSPRGDQTGWDIFYTSGITNNLPALITVPLIYSVPEDAAAMVAYLKKRGYPISWVEMDEEADGQYYMPEDYASLYIQFADAIHKVDPTLRLGGPVYQGINQDVSVWPDAHGDKSWSRRFYSYLKARNREKDLTFASFEIYPFEARTMKWEDLYRNRELTRKTLQSFRDAGMPTSVPLMNTESNLCGSLSVYMSDIFSALWLADNVGAFFEEGGALYVHSPIEPSGIERGAQGYAIWGNVLTDHQGKVLQYLAFYHAGKMINEEWVTHRTGVHHQHPVDVGIQDASGNDLVTAYSVLRPDGRWALLLVNKDRDNAYPIRVSFDGDGGSGHFSGTVRMVTFGSEQYVWHGADATAHADPDLPPVVSSIDASAQTVFTLPKASVTILRGEVVGLKA